MAYSSFRPDVGLKGGDARDVARRPTLFTQWA